MSTLYPISPSTDPQRYQISLKILALLLGPTISCRIRFNTVNSEESTPKRECVSSYLIMKEKMVNSKAIDRITPTYFIMHNKLLDFTPKKKRKKRTNRNRKQMKKENGKQRSHCFCGGLVHIVPPCISHNLYFFSLGRECKFLLQWLPSSAICFSYFLIETFISILVYQ